MEMKYWVRILPLVLLVTVIFTILLGQGGSVAAWSALVLEIIVDAAIVVGGILCMMMSRRNRLAVTIIIAVQIALSVLVVRAIFSLLTNTGGRR